MDEFSGMGQTRDNVAQLLPLIKIYESTIIQVTCISQIPLPPPPDK
jgi:hypothetical protein